MAEPKHVIRARHQSTVEEKDEEVLAEFGYKQELRRDWGLMHNFGISFSIIVRLCCTTTPVSFPLTDAFSSQSLLVSQLCSNMVSLRVGLEVG
jgi:hypothetical protein